MNKSNDPASTDLRQRETEEEMGNTTQRGFYTMLLYHDLLSQVLVLRQAHIYVKSTLMLQLLIKEEKFVLIMEHSIKRTEHNMSEPWRARLTI